MHVVFRESHGLEETETPTDLGQSPADLVVLSFSDSDLGAFAAGWHRGGGPKGRMPTMRLANLTALKHPLSVDTYVEQTLQGAKGILIRLIGGVPYWSYGLQQVLALAQTKGIALAVLPADGREDTRLDEYSTLPVSTLRRLAHLCNTGGEVAAQAALAQMALATGLYSGPVMGAKTLPECGAWCPDRGVIPVNTAFTGNAKRILVTFYRAYLTSADTSPITALLRSLRARGFEAIGLFAPSLKAPVAADWLRKQIAVLNPAAIINATAFSGKGASGTSPLDAANVPVFQIALATSRRKAWAKAERGLSPADLAMHVVLPEIDGRISAGIASFKEPGKRDPNLEYSRFAHRAEPERIEAIINRVTGWLNLNDKPKVDQVPVLVLSTYPGKDWQMAHAVGLDALASAETILSDLQSEGYSTAPAKPIARTLPDARMSWPLQDYLAALSKLPEQLQTDLHTVWGNPEEDPAFAEGAYHFTALRRGKALVALQPERGTPELRDNEYHDLSRTPRHSYVAFYLWLRKGLGADALIHIGAHGTLEWLPGKSVALSSNCWPEALISDLPVIYPFIVNDPGEAAQAKRRIGAVTLGHIPPAQKKSGTPDRMVRLESLLDEFSNADGLDPRRRDRLQELIRNEAQAIGLENELGLKQVTSTAEAITRIDRFVCDIKDSQFGDGLHIFGRVPEITGDFDAAPSALAERKALIDALASKRIDAGPSGSPYRGRLDVLPTGRNLYTTDPRSVPTRASYTQGVKLAEELVRRHLQEEGDYPRGLIVDLWGSATMRTAGEEFAMALHLLGVKPAWDKGSERVSGIEVLPITELNRPRLDVTLRVSGLFRDVFPTLSALYGQAVRAVSDRDESPDWNPYTGQAPAVRVFGPAPGKYGLNMTHLSETYTDEARAQAGEAWLNASSFALEGEHIAQDIEGITERVTNADSFVHLQDLAETDLLLANDYATHEAGFAAAKKLTGGTAQLYHLDSTNPDNPRARSLPEEISRVVHARAANPDWIAGMKRHGFRGAAEIAATLDHMASFAHLSGTVAPHLFDLYHDATLGNVEVGTFLKDANPQAHQAMQDRFRALLEAGLWNTRRNSIHANLERLE